MTRIEWASLVFAISVCAGVWVHDRAWNGEVYVYLGEYRAPANVRELSDYSVLDRSKLHSPASQQLLESATVVRKGGEVGVRFGHPILKREGGGMSFGCQARNHEGVFDRIELSFVGVGIGESGKTASMIVTAACQSLADINQLETIWIPMATVYALPPEDNELIQAAQADATTEGTQAMANLPLIVRLQDIPNEWPESWVLNSVRLYQENNPDETLAFDTAELRTVRPNPISLDWNIERSTSSQSPDDSN